MGGTNCAAVVPILLMETSVKYLVYHMYGYLILVIISTTFHAR